MVVALVMAVALVMMATAFAIAMPIDDNNSFPQVWAENLRARPPPASWASAAADAHAKDVSALREHLIACSKGQWRVLLAVSTGY